MLALLVARRIFSIQRSYVARRAARWAEAPRTGLAALLLLLAVALPGLGSPALAQTPSLLDPPTTPISAGELHSCALIRAGGVVCLHQTPIGKLPF